MRGRIPITAAVAGIALLAAACGGGDAGEGDETTEASPEPTAEDTAGAGEETATDAAITRADADLVIWADDTRAPVLEEIGAQFGEDNDLTVAVQQLDFADIRDNLITRGPVGEGPDVIVGAHDWLGALVTNGAVAPLELGDAAAGYQEVAVEAMTYDGLTYGVPYAVENVALLRNTDLAPEPPPADFQALLESGQALVDAGEAELPIALQVGEQGDVYHFYPLQTSYGSAIFGTDAEGGWNPEELLIDDEGGLAFAEDLGAWADAGYLNADVTFDIARDTFAEGQAPYAITGPWNVEPFTEAGVPFVVEPIPSAGGEASQPFVGVQGFMVSAYAENPVIANEFVLNYLATEDAARSLFDSGQRPPALTSLFEEVSADPVIAGFGEVGAEGQPLPNIPEMDAVWTDFGNAQRDILLDAGEPTELVSNAAERIRGTITAS